MPEIQPFDLRINGQSVPVKNARLTTTMDTATDGFTAQIVVNPETQPDLYEAISPYRFTPATIYIEDELALTGKLTKTTPIKNESGIVYNLAGWSNTFNFIDSALAPPYTYPDQNLHQIAEAVAKQTGTPVNFTAEPGGQFKGATATVGQKGFDFLSPLAFLRNQVISCTPEGELVFQEANTSGQSVGSIIENDPSSLIAKQFTAPAFDGRKRFKTFKVIGRTPAKPGEGLATDKNINQPRHKIIRVNGQTAGSMNETAEWQKNVALIKALTLKIPVVGWVAPDKTIWKPNTLISIQSETMFMPDGFTFLIREVELILDSTSKTAMLSLIPPNVYTKNPVDEPWF